ncbi:DUF523 domain-containing protein [Neorhizobium sp. NPDC001467]|uniref:DUF523 domain-containing protein n=1 Tax=Neorhizobium sp. NPDC001467 TaxID=3390595 RepID=UPI003CFDB3DE
MVEKIIVSACLLGRPVRYNGTARLTGHELLERWQREGRIVSICPELTAGFAVPRPPAEIALGSSGEAVLQGCANVIEATGLDVTALYVAGAHATLALAREHDCRFALLTDGSPSCGSGFIYDGSFRGQTHGAAGVTASLLRNHGIKVFSESRIDELQSCLSSQAGRSKRSLAEATRDDGYKV